MRYRINRNIALQLGLTLNKSNRYRIDKETEKRFLELTSTTDSNNYNANRNTHFTAVSNDGSLMDIEEYCEHYALDYSQVRSWKLITHTAVPFYNIVFYDNHNKEEESFRDQLIKDLQQYSPSFPKLERIDNNDSYLLVIDPADIHIGKLASAFETGETYNNQIAVQRVLSGVHGILDKVSSFKIDKILFIGGNDILHIDTPKRTTTSGTPQDTDGMWHSNFLIAKSLYVNVLEILLSVADVHFTFNPSNHDYMNGFFLAQVIESYFRNCENITFDCSIAHRKGFRYYNNLIGTTHGDGAKQDLLPLLMAQEFPIEWSQTKHRYIYTHHVHHKTSKDYIGITVESLRSPSGTDSWHSRNGYQHAPKAIEAFLHCKQNGQIARISHLF
ncbi:hypothetical protein [Flavobacterium sp.]|uniref:hypothetical protein n=1 Tax=Flavobacterium sp. TaxID=239 RepID=UPI0025E0165E|nr:hypothetical protein [Flavobacterium sp.]